MNNKNDRHQYLLEKKIKKYLLLRSIKSLNFGKTLKDQT